MQQVWVALGGLAETAAMFVALALPQQEGPRGGKVGVLEGAEHVQRRAHPEGVAAVRDFVRAALVAVHLPVWRNNNKKSRYTR